MATKFKVWIDNLVEGTNIQSYSDFVSDSQRSIGFSVGNVASSIRVNSALRQANLVTAALMDAILPNSKLDLTSSVDEVKLEIEEVFDSFASNQDIKNLSTKVDTVNTALENEITNRKDSDAILQTSISKLDANKLNMGLDITGILSASNTSITLTSDKITANSILDFYTSIYGVSPNTVIVSEGSVTLTFDKQSSDMTVGTKVIGSY